MNSASPRPNNFAATSGHGLLLFLLTLRAFGEGLPQRLDAVVLGDLDDIRQREPDLGTLDRLEPLTEIRDLPDHEIAVAETAHFRVLDIITPALTIPRDEAQGENLGPEVEVFRRGNWFGTACEGEPSDRKGDQTEYGESLPHQTPP